MELNKYQSLKKPKDYNQHLLSLVSVVGQLANNDNDDNDAVTMLLGDALEHITCMASLNNVTLDTVAGLNVNTYQPDLHKVINKGDVVTFNKDKYTVHDIIGNQVLIANQTKDIVVDIKDIGR
ncbi:MULTISPECIES: hypothetical protein [Staphylococcus]|uniref:hypothetical protein n=1 Tax=Staphylococcus TaxID=1279 RepID=UPI00208DF5C9|nr:MULTISPECIES: hypothetical protein [Staphylococcus]MCO4332571.1 hypothetical protein [Staphylococcus hyicus]MCO4333749.1 hypothetical protein [Staphylococcus hyicus]MCO4346701.1 hypothetical protein [Staphylococcus agnetis]MCO4356274.1 hypothetical protein [Staphylococcus agnetis]MCO4364398.1 hypothetical protein [Staphylococcus agnetis]